MLQHFYYIWSLILKMFLHIFIKIVNIMKKNKSTFYPKVAKPMFLLLTFFAINSAIAQVHVNPTGTNVAPYNTWATACTDLQTAMNYANTNVISEVWVAKGTYKPTSTTTRTIYFNLKSNVTVYGGFPDIGSPGMANRDYSLNPTILSGDIGTVGTHTNNSLRIINNTTAIANSILDGFILEYGNSTGVASTDGGAMYFTNCNPIIRNCTFRNNYCTRDGGAVYTGTGSILTFENCTFTNNESGDDGGAMTINACNTIINNCTFDNNIAFATSTCLGGAIFVTGAANPTITNNTFTNNISCFGGAIYSDASAFTNNISGNTFTLNVAESKANSQGRGGALYLAGSATGVVNNTISNNTARATSTFTSSAKGAAIYGNQRSIIISDNIISNNKVETTGTATDCGEGGAIWLYLSNGAITNNTITNNSAIRYGGGIYLYQCGMTMTGNTISNNSVSAYVASSGYGGGIYITGNHNVTAVGPTLITNTITNNSVTDNAFASSAYGAGIYVTGSLATFESNQIKFNTSSIYGGGIYLDSDIDPTFNAGNEISNNQATYGGGIAIRNSNDAIFEKGIIISNNIATTNGGAIFLSGTNIIPRFNKAKIFGNTAVNGGAIYIDASPRPLIKNSLIYSNTASADGGAFYFFNGYNPGTWDILNTTIANNTAANGGAIACVTNSDARFRNVIFWGNTATTSAPQVYLTDTGSDPFFNYCNIQGGTAAFAGTGALANYSAGNHTNSINLDPLFADADFRLTLVTSPCIATGNPATTAADFPTDEDMDNAKRVRGVVDIGAYETNNPPQFITLPYPPITDNPGPVAVTMDEDNAPTAFALTLNVLELDNENVTWSVTTQGTNGTASMTATTSAPNPHSQVITYTPNANYNGTDIFVLQITDGVFTDNITVNVTINPINDEPTFVTTPATTSVKSFKPWSYNIVTTDVDHTSNFLTVTCISKPAGMTFTPGANGTATLSWTPDELNVGIYNIVLQVDDTGMPIENSQQTFSFEVISRMLHVPANYPTIQAGIDAANFEDIVQVANGIYNETINFNGKEITVQGNTTDPTLVVINANNLGSVVTFANGETSNSILQGFTLSGGIGTNTTISGNYNFAGYYGGGVYINNSSPTLKYLHIKDNVAKSLPKVGGSGAGMYIGNGANPLLQHIEVHHNTAEYYRGGGICVDNASVTIENSLFYNNEGGNYGGALSLWKATADLDNVTFNTNTASSVNGCGGGIFLNISTIHLNNVTLNGNSATKGSNGILDYGSSYNGTYAGADNRVDIE